MEHIDFQFRNKKYRVIRDPHQFVLSKQTQEEQYTVIGYYSDPRELINRLIKEHFVKTIDGKELLKHIKETTKELGQVIKDAFKAP